MKTKNIMSTVLIGLALVGGAAGAAVYANATVKATQQWHLKDGEPLANAKNASSYELVSSMDTPPDCDQIETVPCIVEFDSSNPSTPNLQAYLNTFTNPSDVTVAAIEKRSE